MTDDAARLEVARGWWSHAVEALATAEREAMLSPAAAVNRAYYAAFYAASAVLICEGRRFVKHAGVRAAVHRELVKPGRLARPIGEAYDQLIKSRQTADYDALARVSTDDAARAIKQAADVVHAMRGLLPPGMH